MNFINTERFQINKYLFKNLYDYFMIIHFTQLNYKVNIKILINF